MILSWCSSFTLELWDKIFLPGIQASKNATMTLSIIQYPKRTRADTQIMRLFKRQSEKQIINTWILNHPHVNSVYLSVHKLRLDKIASPSLIVCPLNSVRVSQRESVNSLRNNPCCAYVRGLTQYNCNEGERWYTYYVWHQEWFIRPLDIMHIAKRC